MILSKLRNNFSSQLRLNMLSGPIGVGIGIIASAVKFPLYIHFLGYEQYGVWLLLSTILTFAQMGLLGIGTAIVKLVAEEYAQNNHEAIHEYFMTALCMLMASGVVIVVTSILFRTQIILLLGLEGKNAELADSLLIYMVFFSIGVLAYEILNSILAGIGRLDISNYSQTALQIIPVPISIPLLLSGKGVESVFLANVFAYLIIFSVNFIKINRTVKIYRLDLTLCSMKRFQRMITFGSTVFLGYMLSMIVVPITKIVITRSIGVEGVPVFELAYRISKQVRSLFEVALRALMPEISNLSSCGSQKSIAKMDSIISKSYRLLFLGAPPLYIVISIFAGVIFKIWLGESFVPSIPNVFRVLLFVSFVSLIGVIPYYFNMGLGRVNRILIHHALCAGGELISIALAINLMPSVNITTIAWCFLPGAVLGTGYLLALQINNHFTNSSAQVNQ